MIPPNLKKLADEVELHGADQFRLRIAFGIACVERVEHLLTDNSIIDALAVGKAYISGASSLEDLATAKTRAAEIARSHPGSNSLDGSGSGAVSTSQGVVAALSGHALEAAEYAAYASVYSYASHAVTDLSAYEDEHDWQVNKLRELVNLYGGHCGTAT